MILFLSLQVDAIALWTARYMSSQTDLSSTQDYSAMSPSPVLIPAVFTVVEHLSSGYWDNTHTYIYTHFDLKHTHTHTHTTYTHIYTHFDLHTCTHCLAIQSGCPSERETQIVLTNYYQLTLLHLFQLRVTDNNKILSRTALSKKNQISFT